MSKQGRIWLCISVNILGCALMFVPDTPLAVDLLSILVLLVLLFSFGKPPKDSEQGWLIAFASGLGVLAGSALFAIAGNSNEERTAAWLAIVAWGVALLCVWLPILDSRAEQREKTDEGADKQTKNV